MNTKSGKSLLTVSIALAMITASTAFAADTLSQDVKEVRQETQIWTTYALSPHLRAHDLKVSVHKGTATLSGNVEEDVNKDLAQQIALGVSGINEVDNQIIVEADYKPPLRSAGRSYGEAIEDTTITATVKSKLLWSKHTDGLAVDVKSKSGKVTLMGTADDATAKDIAARLAMNTRGVNAVDNQLVIKRTKTTAAAKGTAEKAGRDITDSWITTKVKSTFLYSSNVDGSDITVSTDSGIVTLSGKVDSGAERALAIELANNVRGVKSVATKALVL